MKITLSLLAIFLATSLYANDRYYYRSHYNNAVKVVQKQIEFDADVFNPAYGYYDNVPDKIKAQKDYEDAKFNEQLRALVLILLKQQAEKAMPPEMPKEKPSLDEKVLALFKSNKCDTCHGEKATAGIQLVKDGQLTDVMLAERVLIHNVTYGVGLEEQGKKLMPLNGEPLSDDDVETLRLWMLEKAEGERK